MIYVMIPSYADNDLPNTVLSCIRMASGAIPLRIGVFEQASAPDLGTTTRAGPKATPKAVAGATSCCAWLSQKRATWRSSPNTAWVTGDHWRSSSNGQESTS